MLNTWPLLFFDFYKITWHVLTVDMSCESDMMTGHVKYMPNIRKCRIHDHWWQHSHHKVHGHWPANYAVVNIRDRGRWVLNAESPMLHAEFSYILHTKKFLLSFTWPLLVTLLRVYKRHYLPVEYYNYYNFSLITVIKTHTNLLSSYLNDNYQTC